jgi:4-hydroxy-3-polyprenylbenzoate decarboxylase
VQLVISPSLPRTLLAETDFTVEDLRKLGDVVHNHKDIGESIASGSFRTECMVVVRCSVKSLIGIANCYDEDLIVRAADGCLKERHHLVLMLRETPFHAGHISLMEQTTRMGVIIMSPSLRSIIIRIVSTT